MADQGKILSAVDEYAGELVAAQKAEGDAALAALRAEFDAHMATHEPDPPDDPPPPVEGDVLANTAVRVFPSYNGKVYGQRAAVLDLLGDLGIKRISQKMSPAIAGSAGVLDFTRKAYEQHGIKSWLTVGEPRVVLRDADWDKIVGALTGPLDGMVERCYGWNEPNHGRGGAAFDPATWASLTAQHQAQLWERVSPLGIKVGTPQLWSGDLDVHDADAMKVGPMLDGNFDHIGWHLYPRSGGEENRRNIERFAAVFRKALGGDYPVVCTEAGFLDARNYSGGAHNTTPEQKARLIVELVDEYVGRGWGISIFELLDDPDPGESSREANLGLVECEGLDPSTWTPKPAFDALRAHLAG